MSNPNVNDLFWGENEKRHIKGIVNVPFSPGNQWTSGDLQLLDRFAKEWMSAYKAEKPISEKGGSELNTYERASIKSLMTIEYGTSASIEQLIMAQAYFQVVVNQIKANGHDVPKELETALDATTRDLNDKLRADRRRQIKAIELQLEQLMTAEDKRTKLRAELEKLQNLVK